MLDLHCHILPGVDDGATDLDEAVAMARALVAVGFRGVAASPHAGGPGGDTRPCAGGRGAPLCGGASARPRRSRSRCSPTPSTRLTPSCSSGSTPGEVVPIGGSGHWLLVEMPWTGLADPEGVLFRLQAKGLRLLLAHPERHPFLDEQLLRRLVERGVKMQLELASFVGMLGEEAQARAEWLMGERLGHVLATDLHSPRQAELWIRSGDDPGARSVRRRCTRCAGCGRTRMRCLPIRHRLRSVPMGER